MGTSARTPRRSLMVILPLTLALLGAGTPSARATIFTGHCPVQIDFTFKTAVRSGPTLSHPSYDFTVKNALDLPCVVSLNELLRTTAGDGSGWSVSWTCESTAASGSWNQMWNPSLTPVFDGSHIIAGTWGSWTMVVRSASLNFSGVIQLTVHPSDAQKLVKCEQSGIKSLRMIGTMVFQDPEMPAA